MKVEKEALGGQRVEPTEEELALVNRQSRKELTAAEVYLFAVRLCDNGDPGGVGGTVCGQVRHF